MSILLASGAVGSVVGRERVGWLTGRWVLVTPPTTTWGSGMNDHVPQRVWQERPGEISWRCSCDTVHKHVPLGRGVDLVCGVQGERTQRVFTPGPGLVTEFAIAG